MDSRRQVSSVLARFIGGLKNKLRQISALLSDEQLKLALVAPIDEPVEGAKYRVNEIIHAITFAGECRQFRVCGVNNGGYSNVYTVIEQNEMKAYCLKGNRCISKNERSKNEKLEQEAKLWLRLGPHPNLVSAYAVYYINNQLHILIEYVAGQSLHTRLRNGGPLDAPTAAEYAAQICRALLFAQKAFPGFVHGDIKPGNCLIDPSDTLKLSDFGHSFIAGQKENVNVLPVEETTDETRENRRRGGTHPYMAPEMFGSGRDVGQPIDVYAFGVTLFEMLTGRRPFNGPSYEDFFEQHNFQTPPFERLEKLNVPRSLIELIEKCLAKSPAERPPNFADILQQLGAIFPAASGKDDMPENELSLESSEAIERGLSLAVLGEFDEAETFLNRVTNADSLDHEAWAGKALLYASKKQFSRAEQCSRRALAVGGDSFASLFVRARVLCAQGKSGEALRYVDRALTKEKFHAQWLNLKGEILASRKQFDEAARCFKKSFSQDSQHCEPLENLAELCAASGKYEQGIYYAEKSAAINPSSARTLAVLGAAYDRLELYSKAFDYYKKLVKHYPDERHARRFFVKSCLRLCQAERISVDRKLIKLLLAAANRRRFSQRDFVERAVEHLEQRNGDWLLFCFLDDAIAATLIETAPDVQQRLMKILQRASEKRDASSLAENLSYSTGKLFYILGNYADCLRIFTDAVEKYGDAEIFFYYLAACHEVLENWQSALFYYNKAAKIDKNCELIRSGQRRVAAKLNAERLVEKNSFV